MLGTLIFKISGKSGKTRRPEKLGCGKKHCGTVWKPGLLLYWEAVEAERPSPVSSEPSELRPVATSLEVRMLPCHAEF